MFDHVYHLRQPQAMDPGNISEPVAKGVSSQSVHTYHSLLCIMQLTNQVQAL